MSAEPAPQGAPASSTTAAHPLEEVVARVLRPIVERDQGTIAWLGLRDGVAEVALGGACAGCPGQQFTVRSVLLPALRARDPSVTQVRVRVVYATG